MKTTIKISKEKKNNPFTEKCICDWSKDDKYGFIPYVNCPVHGKKVRKMLKKCVPIDSKYLK